MYLLKNGAQLVIETFDKKLHKVSILENHENLFEEAKDGSLVFVMINNGRCFKLACKDAEMIDYDLTDRIVKASCRPQMPWLGQPKLSKSILKV